MALNTFEIELSKLGENESLRLWLPLILPKSKYGYDKFINYLSLVESGKRPKGGIKGEDNGEAISLGGEQIGADGDVYLSKIPYVSFDFYKKSNKGKVRNNDILICKDGALTGKSCYVDFSIFPKDKVMVNEHVFIIRGNEKINQIFLFYYTRTDLFQNQIKDLAYKKKAQPGLNTNHLKKIKIPKVSKLIQDKAVDKIEPIKKKIKELKSQVKQPQEIINKVFEREFAFDLEKVQEEEKREYFYISNDITYRNLNLRTSVRWNKIAPIQKVLYKNNPYIKKLGKYLTSTKNGWSPICRETDTNYYVFGVNSISKDSYIKYIDLKTSNQQKNNIHEYFVKNGDLFVSRGNTVDLVALASVVKDLPDDKDIIFPDLFIKLEVNKNFLLKEYLAHLFNSIIGRFYFKYSAKGKNQTMVKISSDELNNFFLPIPSVKLQQKIVDEIKIKLDKQKEIEKEIENERNKIDKIIEEVIK